MLIKIIQQHVNGQWWVVNRRSLLLTIHNSQFTKSQIAIGALNGASQRKIDQGTNVCLIKNSLNIYPFISLFATSPYLARLLKTYHD